jgi:hypothetical protein
LLAWVYGELGWVLTRNGKQDEAGYEYTTKVALRNNIEANLGAIDTNLSHY